MMGKGKILMVCGGIVTLISVYVLAWYAFDINYFTYYINGIGGIKNIPNIIFHAQSYATYLGIPVWIIYVSIVIIILTLITGVVQILAVKNRILGILGSIIPLLFGIMIIVGFEVSPEWINFFQIFGDRNPLIAEGFPLNLEIPGRPESLGTYTLIFGGILGIIGYYYSKEEIF